MGRWLGVVGLVGSAAGILSSCAGSPETVKELPVIFKGNHALSDSTLSDLIQPELECYRKSPDPTALSDAAFRIAHQYEIEGYAGTQVEFAIRPDRLLFTVRESPWVTLGTVQVKGNRALTSEHLLEGLPRTLLGSVPFSDQLAARIRDQLASAYTDEGYAEVAVSEAERHFDKKESRMDLSYIVSEGKRYTIAGFLETPDIPRLWDRLVPLVGKPYTSSSTSEVEAAVLDDYRQHGHPFAQVRVRPLLSRETGTVRLLLEVSPGPPSRLGGVQERGNVRTRSSFIEGRADLEEGKIYNDADLRRAEKRLLETTLFSRVQVGPGSYQEDSGRVPVEIVVEERDPGEVSFRLGYGTLDGPRGGAEFRYLNLLGGAELFRAGGTVSQFGYRVESELAFPFIFGSDFRPGISGFYEQEEYPSFEALSFGGDISLSHPIVEKVQATIGIRHAIIRTQNVAAGVPPGDLLDFAYTAPFLSLLVDFRDNPLLPTRGFMLDSRLEWSDRSFSADIQYLSVSGRAVFLLPLPWDLDLAASIQGGVIAPIENTQSIPIALRYFAGGTNTVRGFKFASLGPQVNGSATGGEALLALQAELRFPIWGDLHGAFFTDRGNVWTDYRRVNLSDVRYSVGTGLRYYTPAGAIVADFAWDPDRQPGERGWEFHFSIGFPF